MTFNPVTKQVEFAGWAVHVQAAIRNDTYGYDKPSARYGSVTYGSATSEANWQTIDCQVLRVTAGHGGILDQIPGVRAKLGRLNASLYDPERVLDPAASPFQLLTQVGVPIRLVVVAPDGTTYPLWTGISETWEHNLLTGEGQLVASDLISLIAGVDLADWDRPDENGKSRLLAVVGYLPQPMTLVYSGNAVNLSASKFSGTLWNAVTNTSEAEQSIVWVDQWGRLRRSDVTGFGTAVKARDCDDGSSPIIYTKLTSVTDDEVMTNIAIVERLNLSEADKERTPLTYQDAASVTRNGAHSMTQTSLPLLNDAALYEWAKRVLDLRANALNSITGMSVTIVDPGDFSDPAAFAWVPRTVPAIVALQVGHVLDVRLTSRGEPEGWVTAVAGITHTIVPDSWEVDIEVVDGAKIALNRGYDDPTSKYDLSKYSGSEGASPSFSDIVARIFAAEEAAHAPV